MVWFQVFTANWILTIFSHIPIWYYKTSSESISTIKNNSDSIWRANPTWGVTEPMPEYTNAQTQLGKYQNGGWTQLESFC
jgi:hypothetical protein